MRIAGLLLVILTTVGCGGDADLGKPVPISGTVILDGQPLADATVIFSALDGLPPEYRSHTAKTDTSGKFKLSEVYPAEYQVTVDKPAENAEEHAANPGIPALAKYGADSPLRAKVDGSQTEFTFELNSSGP